MSSLVPSTDSEPPPVYQRVEDGLQVNEEFWSSLQGYIPEETKDRIVSATQLLTAMEKAIANGDESAELWSFCISFIQKQEQRGSIESNLGLDPSIPLEPEAEGFGTCLIEVDSEEDSGSEEMPDITLMLQKYRELKKNPPKTWVDRRIKCCHCDYTLSKGRKCECGREFCDVCFEYIEYPVGGKSPGHNSAVLSSGWEPRTFLGLDDLDNDIIASTMRIFQISHPDKSSNLPLPILFNIYRSLGTLKDAFLHLVNGSLFVACYEEEIPDGECITDEFTCNCDDFLEAATYGLGYADLNVQKAYKMIAQHNGLDAKLQEFSGRCSKVMRHHLKCIGDELEWYQNTLGRAKDYMLNNLPQELLDELTVMQASLAQITAMCKGEAGEANIFLEGLKEFRCEVAKQKGLLDHAIELGKHEGLLAVHLPLWSMEEHCKILEVTLESSQPSEHWLHQMEDSEHNSYTSLGAA
ncbi:hypothetical protein FQN57_005138 [Myotisia sp. PD_48]|nr:hypothetical protein FQN57_005138 [Myotisia sp. PD_48]